MSVLPNEWPIKSRADACAATGRSFAPGEIFYTLLFRERDGYRREDLSDEAWAARNENIRPFSFWKSRYEPAASAPPETLGKEGAEDLLRRLLAQNKREHTSTCYVLAAMLERKRVLKQIKTGESENGRELVYEHLASGDVFIVPEPHLRLAELDAVQLEVAAMLMNARFDSAPPAEATA